MNEQKPSSINAFNVTVGVVTAGAGIASLYIAFSSKEELQAVVEWAHKALPPGVANIVKKSIEAVINFKEEIQRVARDSATNLAVNSIPYIGMIGGGVLLVVSAVTLNPILAGLSIGVIAGGAGIGEIMGSIDVKGIGGREGLGEKTDPSYENSIVEKIKSSLSQKSVDDDLGDPSNDPDSDTSNAESKRKQLLEQQTYIPHVKDGGSGDIPKFGTQSNPERYKNY